ncbi:MAG: hypothetical protein ABIO91_06820 [Pyrinomonadaceae bacterium]
MELLEYMILFATYEPKDFLDPAQELPPAPASKFTLPGTPVYASRQQPLMDCLDALGK